MHASSNEGPHVAVDSLPFAVPERFEIRRAMLVPVTPDGYVWGSRARIYEAG